MSNTRELYNKTTTFLARFSASGVPITTATGKIYLFRVSDNMYLVGGLWQVARATSTMTEIDETNQPGYWKFDFDNSIDSANEVDQYVIEMLDDSGNSDNPQNLLELDVGGYLDLVIDAMNRILALQHNNFVMDPLTYDDNGSMLTGKVRAYNSAANALLDDDATGILYRYDISGERTTEGYLGKYTQVKTL